MSIFAKHATWLCRQLAGDARVSQPPPPPLPGHPSQVFAQSRSSVMSTRFLNEWEGWAYLRPQPPGRVASGSQKRGHVLYPDPPEQLVLSLPLLPQATQRASGALENSPWTSCRQASFLCPLWGDKNQVIAHLTLHTG